jgi:hypothetical protein
MLQHLGFLLSPIGDYLFNFRILFFKDRPEVSAHFPQCIMHGWIMCMLLSAVPGSQLSSVSNLESPTAFKSIVAKSWKRATYQSIEEILFYMRLEGISNS